MTDQPQLNPDKDELENPWCSCCGMAPPDQCDCKENTRTPDDAAMLEVARRVTSPFIEALLWCTGSSDFGEGGQARTGWLKVASPLIEMADATLLRIAKGLQE